MRGLVRPARALLSRPGASTGQPSGGAPATAGSYAVRATRRPAGTIVPGLDNTILSFRLIAILAAQLFDFSTFVVMVQRHGIRAELNPLVVSSFHASGLLGLLAAKLVLVAFVGGVIILLGRQTSPIHVPSRLATFITVLAVLAGVFGGWTNAITI